MRKPIPYGRQYINDDDKKAVLKALDADFLTTGPLVAEFENEFSNYVEARFSVAVANGTAALHLCAIALGVNETSKVILSPITFAASSNCIKYCSGSVEFFDIDKDTLLLDLDLLESRLNNCPKGTYSGVVAVDFAGYPTNLERLRAICEKHGLWIIEDSCHAPGGFFTDSSGVKQKCGNGKFADLAIFSFHPVKHIACGEGGMITTNDPVLYQKLLRLRTHGITKNKSLLGENHGGWYYEMIELGYNYRMPDILCALGISQLTRAEENLRRRRLIAKRYDEAFEGLNIRIHPPLSDQLGHAYHLYIIQVERRKELYDFLRENHIYAQIHYIPVHTLPYYQGQGHEKGIAPIAEEYYQHCLSLPLYPSLTNEEHSYVINTIKRFLI